MKNQFIITGILFLLFAGCKSPVPKETTETAPLRVKLAPAEMIDYKLEVRVTGMLSTATEMKLSFKTGGIIQKIDVKEGTSVNRGQVLAMLDLAEVKAQVNQAQIGLEKAQRDLTRARNLYRDSVATLEQYQNARSAFELARSQKQVADFNLQHSQIKAPSEGKIQKILVETNEMIGPGYPAILFASTENDWVVRVALTDKDIVKLALGDSGRVSMDAFPGLEFKAEITELGTVADPVTGTYEAELLILQSRPQFRTGFISRVDIYPTQLQRSLVVPVEALLDASDDRAYVFVSEENQAVKKRIKIGSLLQSRVVVLEGLQEGELVVTVGAKYLQEDDRIDPVDKPDTLSP